MTIEQKAGVLLGVTAEPCVPPSRNRMADWRIYAAAAGATLAMSSNADADIVYSGPLNIQVTIPTVVANKTQSKIKTFALASGIVGPFVQRTKSGAISAAELLGSHVNFRVLGGVFTKLNPGSPVLPFSHSSSKGLLFANFRGATVGAFGPGTKSGYVGFVDTKSHAGWIQAKVLPPDVGIGRPTLEVDVLGWAYNDVAGEGINAGQTSSSVPAVPEPGTAALSLLAAGAAGILAWRKRRAEAIAQAEAKAE